MHHINVSKENGGKRNEIEKNHSGAAGRSDVRGTSGRMRKQGDGDEKGSGDKITIRLLTRMAGTTAQVDIYNDILDEFKEKHPEVTIVDDSQGDESAFNNILSTDIASGTMANIFRIQGVANLSEYIDNGLILDVQPYLDEDPEWGGGFTEERSLIIRCLEKKELMRFRWNPG